MSRYKEWEELTISDNFLFQKVMQNKSLCKHLIEKLIDIKVKDITYPAGEKIIDNDLLGKSVRLDLYVKTENGTIIDIEMQTSDGVDGWLAKRARYYQAMIDLDTLSKGQDYVDLKRSYVIFICTFDPFGLNRKIYTFTNRCHETKLELGDEATKIFLSTAGTVGKTPTDINNFLAYIGGKPAKGKFTKDVATEAERLKRHEETRLEYMTLLMELKRQRREGYADGEKVGLERGLEQGKKEGHEQGAKENLRNIVVNMLRRNLSLREISELCNTTADNIRAIAKQHGLTVNA